MTTTETTRHGVSVSNRMPARLEVDKSCEGSKTIYVDQSDYLEELSNIKEGFTYCIDSLIDLNGFEIVIPSYGLHLHGMSNAAGLTDSTDEHTMFKSEGEGSGNITITNLNLTQAGSNSALFWLWSQDSFNDFALELSVMSVVSFGAIYNFDTVNELKNSVSSMYNNFIQETEFVRVS